MESSDARSSNSNLISLDSVITNSSPEKRNSFSSIFDPVYASCAEQKSNTTSQHQDLYSHLLLQAQEISSNSELTRCRSMPIATSYSAGNSPLILRKPDSSAKLPNSQCSAFTGVQDPFNHEELQQFSSRNTDSLSSDSQPSTAPKPIRRPRTYPRSGSMGMAGRRLYPVLPTGSSGSLSSIQHVVPQIVVSNSETILPDMQQFIDVVRGVRNQWPYHKKRTNLGLVCSPVMPLSRKLSLDSKTSSKFALPDVHVEIHSNYIARPFRRSCNPNTTSVFDLLIEVIFCTTPDPSEQLSLDKFNLRIFGRSEYILPDCLLADFVYVQECCRQNLLLKLILEEADEISTAMKRTEIDDQSELILPNNVFPMQYADPKEQSDIYVECYTKEKEKLLDCLKNKKNRHILTKEDAQLMKKALLNWEQALKGITSAMCNMASADLQRALLSVHIMVNKLMCSKFQEIPDKKLDLTLQDVDRALAEQLTMVSRLVCIDITHSALSADTREVQPPKPSTECTESVLVNLIGVYRLNPKLSDQYESFKVTIVLSYAGEPLRSYWCSRMKKKDQPSSSISNAIQTSEGVKHQEIMHNFTPIVFIDQWLKFPNYSVKQLPREATFSIVLYGISKIQDAAAGNQGKDEGTEVIGWANLPLFDSQQRLLQGNQLIGLWPKDQMENTTQLNTSLQATLLHIYLSEFDTPLEFPACDLTDQANLPLCCTDNASDKMKMTLKAIEDHFWLGTKVDMLGVPQDSAGQATDAGMELMSQLLWKHRGLLLQQPSLMLPFVLAVTQHWPSDIMAEDTNWADFMLQIYYLLAVWSPPQPVLALRLLGPDIADIKIRQQAVIWLSQLLPDELQFYLPQLIEGFKHDLSLCSSGLVVLLLNSSMQSINFANALYWQLKECPVSSPHSRRLELLFHALLRCSGAGLRSVWKTQEEVIKLLSEAAETVKQANPNSRDSTLYRNLYDLEEWLLDAQRSKSAIDAGFRFLHSPGIVGCKLDLTACTFFKSNTLPLKIAFKNIDAEALLHQVMFKIGDDLRQDRLITQLIRFMDLLWLSNGLDLRVVNYTVLSTAGMKGTIEIIPDCATLLKVQTFKGDGANNDKSVITDWLVAQNTTEFDFKKAAENFLFSCAGCCMVTYVLGVCDRHNDNIMIKHSGHVFHIDFSKIFGDAQKMLGISRDRVDFVFTPDMRHVIQQYDKVEGPGAGMRLFIDRCCEAYHILRTNLTQIISLMVMLKTSGIPAITDKAINFVIQSLRPGDQEMEANEHIKRLIDKSLHSKSTLINFQLHNIAMSLKTSSDESAALFPFTMKTYSVYTEPKIERVRVLEVLKQSSPKNYYTYKTAVYHEGRSFPIFVFRRFSHWQKLADHLANRFPEGPVPLLTNKYISRHANCREDAVATECRKQHFNFFLEELFDFASEISHCDIVYTFFHSTLMDEQQLEESESVAEWKILTIQRENPEETAPSIQLRICRSIDQVKILVMHAKNLRASQTGSAPDVYAKLYLRPSIGKDSKRKTHLIRKSCNPSFNQMFTYPLTTGDVMLKSIEVSIWQSVSFSSHSIGSTNIALDTLEINKDTKSWYPLVKPTIVSAEPSSTQSNSNHYDDMCA